MKGIVRSVCALALVGAVVAVPAGGAAKAGSKPIEISDAGPTGGSYLPKQYEARLASRAEGRWSVGDSVVAHDVVEDKRLFRSPSEIASRYEIQLSAGSYPYYCTFHGSPGHGMHGTVAVPPTVEWLGHGKAKVTWATRDSSSGDRFDVDWRIKGSGKWKHWKQGTKSLKATFAGGKNPVEVDPSKAYEVRVRSFDSAKRSRRSDWSPAVHFGR